MDTSAANSERSWPKVEGVSADLSACSATYDSGALFRGLSPSLIRAVPAAASTFVAFELTRGKHRLWALGNHGLTPQNISSITISFR